MHQNGLVDTVPEGVSLFLVHRLPTVPPLSSPSLQQQQGQQQQPTISSAPVTTCVASRHDPKGSRFLTHTSKPQTGLRRSAASQYGAVPTPSWMPDLQNVTVTASSASAQSGTSLGTQTASREVDAPQMSSLNTLLHDLQPTHMPSLFPLQLTVRNTRKPALLTAASEEAVRFSAFAEARAPSAESCRTVSSPGLSEADWLQLQGMQKHRHHQQQQQPWSPGWLVAPDESAHETGGPALQSVFPSYGQPMLLLLLLLFFYQSISKHQ